MKNIFILCMLWIVVTTGGIAQDSLSAGIYARADSLYHNFHEVEALELYKKILQHDPQHYRALWRISFLYSRIGYRLEEEDSQREYYNKGIEWAERALQVDSADSQANFVMAVAQGRKAMISGAQERVRASRSIKHYAERAIRLDSTNAGAWHVLGRWHFKVANLNFVERLAANTLFGGIPKASETEAVSYIQKAIELNPRYILYYYDLARMYKHLGREQQAVATCKKALNREPLTPDDPGLQQKCRELIKTIR